MADLAKLNETYAPDEPFAVELRGPDGAALFNDDDTPMTISVLGADSDTAVKARNASANRRIQAGPRGKITAEGIDSDAVAYLAKLTVDWNITMNKEKPPFSADAVKALYANPRLAFIREQVDQAIGERSNFMKA